MYTLSEHGVIREQDNAFIPADTHNRDWRQYLIWKNQGNRPKPLHTQEEARRIEKETQLRELDTQKQAALYQGIEYLGHRFSLTESTLNKISRAYVYAQQHPNAAICVGICDCEGKTVTLTFPQLKRLFEKSVECEAAQDAKQKAP